jgi:hypothetical protein
VRNPWEIKLKPKLEYENRCLFPTEWYGVGVPSPSRFLVDSLPGSGNCSIADKESSLAGGGQSETSDAGSIRSGE